MQHAKATQARRQEREIAGSSLVMSEGLARIIETTSTIMGMQSSRNASLQADIPDISVNAAIQTVPSTESAAQTARATSAPAAIASVRRSDRESSGIAARSEASSSEVASAASPRAANTVTGMRVPVIM